MLATVPATLGRWRLEISSAQIETRQRYSVSGKWATPQDCVGATLDVHITVNFSLHSIVLAKRPKKTGGSSKKSSFESELTNVGRKSVKGLRYKYVYDLYVNSKSIRYIEC